MGVLDIINPAKRRERLIAQIRSEIAPDLIAQGRMEANANIADTMRALISDSPSPIGSPAVTYWTQKRPVYALDFPWRYSWSTQSPRKPVDSLLDRTTLRNIADTYDIARSCIEHLKAQVRSTPGSIQPKDPNAANKSATEKRVKRAKLFFDDEGGLGGIGRRISHFENEIFEDCLVLGNFSVFFENSQGGQLLQALPIDAATIKPIVDAYGWDPDGPKYEQWILGAKVTTFDWTELYFDGLAPRSWTPFYIGPLEWLVSTITSALRADEWNRSWLNDGNTPSDVFSLPADWTPEQVQIFTEWWDMMLSGNIRARAKTKFVPNGTTRLTPTRQDQQFSELERWMMIRTCAIFKVHPTAAGYIDFKTKTEDEEKALHSTSRFGVEPLLEARKALYDRILRLMGFDDLEWINDSKGRESPGARGQRLMVSAGGPWVTVNEARKEEGLPPIADGDTVRETGQDLNKSGNIAAKGKKNGQDAKPDSVDKQLRAVLWKWGEKAANRLNRTGSAVCDFVHTALDNDTASLIKRELETCSSEDDVYELFGRYMS